MIHALAFVLALWTWDGDEPETIIREWFSESPEQRDQAERKLRKLGKAALSALEKAATGKDIEVASRARQLIKSILFRESVPSRLKEAWSGIEAKLEGDDRAWTEAFLELAAKRAQKAPAFNNLRTEDMDFLLAKAIRGSESLREKRRICNAVQDWNCRSATPEIAALLRDDDITLSLVVEEILVARGLEAIPSVRKLFETKRVFPGLDAASRILVRLDARQCIPDLVQLVQVQDQVPYYVRRALAYWDANAAVPYIEPFLKAPEPHIRRNAISLLGALGAGRSSSKILPALKESDVEVRTAAIAAVGQLQAKEAVPELIRLLGDKENRIRGAACWALREVNAKEAAPLILPLLKDPDPRLREGAALMLGAVRAREATPDVARALQDPDGNVRLWAAAALCQLGSDKGTAYLLDNAEQNPRAFNFLNALRSPSEWNRLKERKCKGWYQYDEGKVEPVLQEVTGAKVETSGVDRDPNRGSSVDAGQASADSLGVLHLLADLEGLAFILEPGRVLLLPRSEAVAFWKQWLAEELRKAGPK